MAVSTEIPGHMIFSKMGFNWLISSSFGCRVHSPLNRWDDVPAQAYIFLYSWLKHYQSILIAFKYFVEGYRNMHLGFVGIVAQMDSYQ